MKEIALVLIVFQFLGLFSQESKECDSGNEYYQNYEFQNAVSEFETCLKLDSNNIEVLSLLASSYFQLGLYDNAKKCYAMVNELDSTNRTAYSQLSKIYAKQGNIEEATKHYKFLVDLDSNNSYFLRNYATLLISSGSIQKGINNYLKCLRLSPNDIFSAIKLSIVYSDLKQPELSLGVLNDAIKVSPRNTVLLEEIAKLYYKLKDYKKAVNSVEEMYKLGADSSLLSLKILGISYFQLTKYREAIELLEEVDKRSESNEAMHYYLGTCYLELDQLEKSETHLQKAIELGISNNLNSFYTNLALVYEKQNNYKASISAYKLAYQYSKNKILLYHLARNYDIYYKDKSTAMEYYQKYLDQNDTNNLPYMDYSEFRISELKTVKHFNLDTLN